MTSPEHDQHWYIGFVKPCQEKKTAELLNRFGYCCYLPIQKVRRKWSDRFKVVDQLVIPRMIFVHATDAERRKSLSDIPMLYAYMMDRGRGKPAVVRNEDMESFRFMVEHGKEEVTVQPASFSPGDKVRVIQGPMKGLECEFVSSDGTSGLAVVRLGMLGAATVNISGSELEKI